MESTAHVRLLAPLLAMMLVGPGALQAAPSLVGYTGRLTESNGAVLVGPVDLTVALFDGGTDGAALFTETHLDVPLDDGHFSLLINEVEQSASFDALFAAHDTLYLELTVASEPLLPRLRLSSVPWALAGTGPTTLSWSNLSDLPAGFADGIDDGLTEFGTGPGQVAEGNHTHAQYLTAESDPQVGTLAGSKVCVANSGGTAIECVGDNLLISGNLQVGGSYLYAAAQTGYAQVHAAAFTPAIGGVDYGGTANGGYRYVPTTATEDDLNAAFNLPHGVSLTNLTCRVFDNASVATANVGVGIVDQVNNVWLCGPFYSTGATAAVQQIGGACSHTIDNANRLYYLRFYPQDVANCGANCRLYGCHLTYTYMSLAR